MSIFDDAIRPYWLPGLNAISGKTTYRFTNWISQKEFQIYHKPEKESFLLNIADSSPLLSAFAFDFNRMTNASLESLHGIRKNPELPKSIGWMIIKIYYAAFYAAHAMLRMFGTSLTQLGYEETSSINDIGDLYGFTYADRIEKGFYECTFDANAKTLSGKKLNLTGGGTHEILWKIFHDTLIDMSNKVLVGPGLSTHKQLVSSILSDICQNLSCGPCGANRNWLSFIRNKITYKHEFSVWFPYTNYSKNHKRLHDIISLWKSDPVEIRFYKQTGRELQRFVETCCAIVAILKTMTVDMSKRCPKGRSFLTFGPISFLNQTKIAD